MTGYDCWPADHVIDEPDQIITVCIDIIQAFVMRGFPMTVYVDCIDMPVLAERWHDKGVIFPDAHLAVDHKKRRPVIFYLAVIDDVS